MVGRSLEAVVVERVIGDLDGQALDGRVQRGALGHRPRPHGAADLQTQVEVTRGGRVLAHDERARAHAADRELCVSLDPYLARVHLDDGGATRALAQERDERRDRRRGALRVHFHGVVV